MNEVDNEEDDAEKDASSSHHNVANRQEVVRASQHVHRSHHEVLAASEGAHVVQVLNYKTICTLRHILLNHAVQLAEVGQTSRTHPYNEVF